MPKKRKRKTKTQLIHKQPTGESQKHMLKHN